jgi:hypothetical protein
MADVADQTIQARTKAAVESGSFGCRDENATPGFGLDG